MQFKSIYSDLFPFHVSIGCSIDFISFRSIQQGAFEFLFCHKEERDNHFVHFNNFSGIDVQLLHMKSNFYDCFQAYNLDKYSRWQ